VAAAVGSVLSDVAQAVDRIVDRLKNNGRLLHRHGHFRRLGVLDALNAHRRRRFAAQKSSRRSYEAGYQAVEASKMTPLWRYDLKGAWFLWPGRTDWHRRVGP
jgi:hypothetical protein